MSEVFELFEKLIPFIFILAGFGILYIYVSHSKKRMDKSQYLITQGVVTKSSVEKRMVATQTSYHTVRWYYRPEIEYKYKVNGRDYYSSNIYLFDIGIESPNKSDSLSITRKYSLNKEIDVYYDKENVSRSFLIEKRPLHIAIMIVAAFCLLIGSILFYAAFY